MMVYKFKWFLFGVSLFIASGIAVIGLLWPSNAPKAQTLPRTKVIYPEQAGRDLADLANFTEKSKGTGVRLFPVHCVREVGLRFSCLFNQTKPHYCRFVEFVYKNSEFQILQSGFVLKHWCHQ